MGTDCLIEFFAFCVIVRLSDGQLILQQGVEAEMADLWTVSAETPATCQAYPRQVHARYAIQCLLSCTSEAIQVSLHDQMQKGAAQCAQPVIRAPLHLASNLGGVCCVWLT